MTGGQARRTAASIALPLAPILLAAANFLVPINPDSAEDLRDQLQTIVDEDLRVNAAGVLILAALCLFLTVRTELVRLLVPGRPRWAMAVAALLAIAVPVYAAGIAGLTLAEGAFARIPPEALNDSVAALQQVDRTVGVFGAVWMVGTLALTLGLLLAAVGLHLARAAPPWVAALLGVGALGCGMVDSTAARGIAFLVVAVPLAYVAWHPPGPSNPGSV